MAGILVLASPNPAWAYDRNFDKFDINRVSADVMRIAIALSLVASQNPPQDCLADVPVVVKKVRRGADLVIARGRTDEDGRLNKRTKRRRGRFYAIAKRHITQAGNECYESRSPTIAFRD